MSSVADMVYRGMLREKDGGRGRNNYQPVGVNNKTTNVIFSVMTAHINVCIDRGSSKEAVVEEGTTFINLLDISIFELFYKNSFQQCSIN